MKILLPAVLLVCLFCLTGCDTTYVESGPAYRRPVVREGYYGDNRPRERYYRDNREYRDVQVVRSYDGSYYRPVPAPRRTVVVVNRSNSSRYSRSREVNHRKDDDRHDSDHDKKKKKKKKKHDDN